MTKHTPGPWRVDAIETTLVRAPDGYPITDTARHFRETEECAANARLIAVAQELLEFAEKIFNGLDTGMIRMDSPADETLANILGRGRKALDKVKGSETYHKSGGVR